jgi:hypothetical protein
MKPSDVDAVLDQLPAEALNCRVYGHDLRPHDAWYVGRKAVEVRLRCRHCGTQRRILQSRVGGDILASGYVYPDGYLITGVGRLTGSDRGRARIRALAGLPVRQGPPDE